ncbi:hypothetical protein AVEN_176973-1 [Araneus ventricosus]|uniref:Uncharacterized protein n=1 Tax=Araneus ventricosus TaxID=182803 RepID=A0A4Y2NXX4_ARAVE|nr:hypothetical protein AVEN_176973-1 [Araneus ventricosus]
MFASASFGLNNARSAVRVEFHIGEIRGLQYSHRRKIGCSSRRVRTNIRIGSSAQCSHRRVGPYRTCCIIGVDIFASAAMIALAREYGRQIGGFRSASRPKCSHQRFGPIFASAGLGASHPAVRAQCSASGEFGLNFRIGEIGLNIRSGGVQANVRIGEIRSNIRIGEFGPCSVSSSLRIFASAGGLKCSIGDSGSPIIRSRRFEAQCSHRASSLNIRIGGSGSMFRIKQFRRNVRIQRDSGWTHHSGSSG